MAEIRIEKKSNSILPWILGVLALLLAGWLLLAGNDDDAMDDRTTLDATEEAAPIAVADREDRVAGAEAFDPDWDGSSATYDDNVQYYLSSVDFLEAQMSLDHDYSNHAMRALANSLAALARQEGLSEEVHIKQATEKLRTKAGQVTEDWRSNEHADQIKAAAMTAADVMQQIQQRKFPEQQEAVAEVSQAAEQIDTQTLTLEQKNRIKAFFRSAADALEEMRDVGNG